MWKTCPTSKNYSGQVKVLQMQFTRKNLLVP